MLLSFKETFADGTATDFERKILAGSQVTPSGSLTGIATSDLVLPKLHTMRRDKNNLWAQGQLIQFCVNRRTPRQREFGRAVCTGTQAVLMNGLYAPSTPRPDPRAVAKLYGIEIRVSAPSGLYLLNDEQSLALLTNDGFRSADQFIDFFGPMIASAPGGLLELKLIHWTDLRYGNGR